MANQYFYQEPEREKGEAHSTNSDLTRKAEEAGEIARGLCVPGFNFTQIPASQSPTNSERDVAHHYRLD